MAKKKPTKKELKHEADKAEAIRCIQLCDATRITLRDKAIALVESL